jgi:hypothetical protein
MIKLIRSRYLQLNLSGRNELDRSESDVSTLVFDIACSSMPPRLCFDSEIYIGQTVIKKKKMLLCLLNR